MLSIKFIRYYTTYFISSKIHYNQLWFLLTPYITQEPESWTKQLSQATLPVSGGVKIETQVPPSHTQELRVLTTT